MQFVNKQTGEVITTVKGFVVAHQDGLVSGAVATGAAAGLYAGLTMVKIKWLVLLGLIVVTGGLAGAAYFAAIKLIKKCEEE